MASASSDASTGGTGEVSSDALPEGHPGVTIDEIYGKRQTAKISGARKIACYVIREVTNMSYENIGEEFHKHHSTVMYNINEISRLMKSDTKLARQVSDIVTNIKDETSGGY